MSITPNMEVNSKSSSRPARGIMVHESLVGKRGLPYLFLLPAAILLLGLLISPIITGVVMSFQITDLGGTTLWSGVANYKLLIQETRFLGNVRNSIVYVLGNIILSTPLAYAAALLITSKFTQAQFFRGFYLLPWIIAPVVSTVLFRSMLDPRLGPIAKLIEWLAGREVIILADPFWALAFVVFHSFWRSFPFVMLFLAAGIATIPGEIYEAATVDGAGRWKRFIHLTLPMTSNQLGISLLIITIWTLHDAETIYAFTGGGPGYSTETLAVRLFKSSFINFDLNMGATIGVILIVLSLIFMSFYLRLTIGRGAER